MRFPTGLYWFLNSFNRIFKLFGLFYKMRGLTGGVWGVTQGSRYTSFQKPPIILDVAKLGEKSTWTLRVSQVDRQLATQSEQLLQQVFLSFDGLQQGPESFSLKCTASQSISNKTKRMSVCLVQDTNTTKQWCFYINVITHKLMLSFSAAMTPRKALMILICLWYCLTWSSCAAFTCTVAEASSSAVLHCPSRLLEAFGWEILVELGLFIRATWSSRQHFNSYIRQNKQTLDFPPKGQIKLTF